MYLASTLGQSVLGFCGGCGGSSGITRINYHLVFKEFIILMKRGLSYIPHPGAQCIQLFTLLPEADMGIAPPSPLESNG